MKLLHWARVAIVGAIVLSGAARAETPKPSLTPSPSSAPAHSPGLTPTAAPRPGAPAPASGMSESKYLSLLYAEIAKHTPEENVAGPGEVTASFVVGASGAVEKVTIEKTSSPAHAEIVKKILASVAAPPPPGGAMDLGQTFKFR
jgi:hypothetical protein